ncbi:helix-turn-helix domain-containing protein [Clostridium perfringens]|uniref:helix-turn-helix domain-containing protein n=1 Tax=Clostridium perfringens TaxID=1502 RepID=UPI0039E7B6E2|nr:helix-turn-helix domain-containing protein [Clostridium perfringens]
MNDLNFNEKLKYYREKANISKSELARRIQVSPSYITMLESGEKTNPSLEIQLKLANALNCSILNLTGEKKGLREYVLQILLNGGFSIEEISKNVDVPVSELENIANGKSYDNENGLKLIKNIPNLFLTNYEDIKPINTDTLFNVANAIGVPATDILYPTNNEKAAATNKFQDIIKETYYYPEIIKAFKTITTYTNSNLNKELDSLTTKQIDELKQLVSDYTEFQLTKILKK